MKSDVLTSCRAHVLAVALCSVPAPAVAQSYTLDFIDEITFPNSPAGCSSTDVTGGSDVWGYTASDGTEYAIMGVRDGVAVVRIPDMTVIDVVPGPKNGDCWWHRDIKTLGDYAYVVSEMTGTNQGLMILDLSDLPDSVRFVGAYAPPLQVRSHNLSIDTATGYAYICNQSGTGFRIVDLSDPESPVDVHMESTGSIHDVFALNDIVYVAEGFSSDFTIYDVTDKQNPQLLVAFSYPGAGYTHNIWPTDDSKYVMTTEETNDKTIKMWDVQDIGMGVVDLVGEYLAPNRLAHNTHVLGDLAVVSHYSYGVAVVDISDVMNPVEVARYDTYTPDDDPGFWGCWGVYPYTDDGYVYASDFRGHLTLLQLVETATSVEPVRTAAIRGPLLAQNVPNPFNPTTALRYTLDAAAHVTLAIYGARGQLVRVLVDGPRAAGTHEETWNGVGAEGMPLPSGVYFQRLTVGGGEHAAITRKMVMVK